MPIICPHVKVGLSLDDIIRIYKRKPIEHHKNDTFICLKCGYENRESTLSQHAHQMHAHQIALQVKTMEIWCFRCKKTLTYSSGNLYDVVSHLIKLPFFYLRTSSAATSNSKFNIVSRQVTSQVVKTNANVKSKVVGTGQKNFKTPLPVSRSSNASVIKQSPAVTGSPKRRQCPVHNYQPIRNNIKKNEEVNKRSKMYNQSFNKQSIKGKTNTPMLTDYKLGGNRQKYNNHKPSMLSNGSKQLNSHNHSGSLRDVKKNFKVSTNNGKSSVVTKPTVATISKPTSELTSKCIGKTVSRLSIHNPIDTVVSKPTSKTTSKPTVVTVSKPSNGTIFKPIDRTVSKPAGETVLKPTDGNIFYVPIPEYKPIVGLKNIGNTCFFNSVLQIIYQSRYLHYYINIAIECPYKSKLKGPEGLLEFKVTKPPGQLTIAINRFLNEIESPAEVRNPALLLNTLATRYKRFRGFDQQDSHEAFRCLLDGLKMEEIKRYHEGVSLKLTENSLVRAKYEKLARKCRTFVDETFGGILSSTVICRNCCTPTQLAEPFFDLSLSISGLRKKKHGNSEVEDPYRIRHFLQCRKKLYYQLKEYKENDRFDALEACLRSYTTLEVLDDDNKFICDTCTKNKANDSLASASKSSLDNLVLCPVSKLLLLHELPKILVLHLKRFKLGSMVTKDNRHIDFPFELDVAPYCTNDCERYMKDNRIMYSLYGVVVHHGSLHGGHYTAYVKAAGIHNTTMWYYASDSHVRSARVDEIKKSNAYMLFYESTNMLFYESTSIAN